MPIPVDIDDLSTNPALNSPSGSDPPTEGDNHIRALASIIRQEHEDTTDIFDQLASQGTASMGAGMVGWSASIAYTTGVGKKLLQSIHVEDYGAVGDGVTDDYAAIDNALTAAATRGLQVVFDGTKTYLIGSELTIPAGTRFQTNGALFTTSLTTTGDTYLITIGDSTHIDALIVSLPTGKRRDRCVKIDGDDNQIGSIHLSSVDQQDSDAAADGGIQIYGSRNHIGRLRVQKWDRAVALGDTDGLTIEWLEIEDYERGLWFIGDNTNLHINGGRIHGASPNADGSAGDNGVLLSNDAVQRNVWITRLAVEDATEHGWRMGGPETQSNVWFTECSALNCGGNGFKVLGTDSGTPSDLNENTYFINCVAEDCGTDSSLSGVNRSGFLIKFATDVKVVCPVVKAKNETYAAQYGIVTDAVTRVIITSPDIVGCELDGILIFASDGDNNGTKVDGGVLRGNGQHGLHALGNTGVTIRQFHVQGIQLHGNGDKGFNIDVNGGGFTDNFLNFKSLSNTGGFGAVSTLGLALQGSVQAAELSGTPLSGIAVRNGSWIDDGTTLNIRKGGAWTAL